MNIFKVEKFWTDFDEILHEYYATESHPKLAKL
jgi:hypothetical protein